MINCIHTDDFARMCSVATGSCRYVLDALNGAPQVRPVHTMVHNAPQQVCSLKETLAFHVGQ